MGIFGKKKGGLVADVIRCDEPDYLIWKWHPEGAEPGNNRRENAIRWESSLRVKDGSVAVFVYKKKDGTVQDYIEGPFDEILSTKNLPVISGIIGLAYDGDTPFQAEVYFINLARIIQTKFAVPFFDVFDPRFLDFGVPTAVRGTISFKITNYREFIKIHRLEEFSMEKFQQQIKDAVSKYVKNIVANLPSEDNIPVAQLERATLKVNEKAEEYIKPRFLEDFGVIVSAVDVGTIEIDKTSDGYQQLKAVTQDVTTATIQAQTEVNIKNLHDMQRINAENIEETMRIQREEGQYAQHLQTQSSNIAVHQINKQAEVGVAGANALGQMGANGGTSMDGGGGMNPAGMMVGMAMGGVVGQNIAGMMNGAMNGLNQPQGSVAPPPVPTLGYNVVINGQSSGPYDMATLSQMAINGQINSDSLVWKAGMANWAKAGTIQELQGVLANNQTPPPVPPAT